MTDAAPKVALGIIIGAVVAQIAFISGLAYAACHFIGKLW